MTRPTRFLVRMLLFLASVAAVAYLLFDALEHAFATNPVLNSIILAVLLLGIVFNLRQVLLINPEVAWIETFRRDQPEASSQRAPRLLAPMARMLADRRGSRFTLSATAMRSLLDGIASRQEESRDISRYLTSLLIFLGLLGTFWGLLITINAVADAIGAMNIASGDVNALFEQLKSGLASPLRGMGTAFSASMFGLAGSLVVGFLDLQAAAAQNRFFNDLEEWLAAQTRLSSGALPADGEGSMPAFVQALLEQTAENLEGLQRILGRGEEGRVQANAAIMQLTERLGTLTDQMRASQQLLLKLAEGQAEIRPALQRLAAAPAERPLDEATRTHIRNMEIYLARLLDEAMNGRTQAVNEIRSEIRTLARTIAALAEEPPR
ncbi:MAG: flagellar motor protein MotA [Alphaproteobacteria bacterium]|nr:flagellar motor protein MotA [Alphaproteobacteria bacterium]